MGTTEFLLGAPGQPSVNLANAISIVQDASAAFLHGWSDRDLAQTDRASKSALAAFDHIVGEVMRSREDYKDRGIYNGSLFQAEMNAIAALMIAPVTRNAHRHLSALGPGNGRLPTTGGMPKAITLEKLLNKIKHRNRIYMNFRVDVDRHIFLICPDNTDGSPDSIVEFGVKDFCHHCRRVEAAL